MVKKVVFCIFEKIYSKSYPTQLKVYMMELDRIFIQPRAHSSTSYQANFSLTSSSDTFHNLSACSDDTAVSTALLLIWQLSKKAP